MKNKSVNKKIKIQRKKVKLLAMLTALSLVGCTNSKCIESKEEISSVEIISEPVLTNVLEEKGHIEIVDKNGIIYPTKLNNFEKTKYDAFANMSIPLYNSYNDDKQIIGVIPEYQWMDRIYSNEKFSYVVTEDKQTGYVNNNYITILPDNYVEVDLSEQKVMVVNNNEIVLYCNVVTGKPGTETNIGYTEVLSKTYNRPMVGPGYRLDVQYCIEFNTSEECFHDNYGRSEFGGDIYLTNGSHGCVNMRLEDVKILDENTEIGTKVLVHK